MKFQETRSKVSEKITFQYHEYWIHGSLMGAEVDVWSDKKRQNQERTHPRNDKSSAGVQKDNGEKTEMVWARHEDGGRSRSEESDDESDTGEKEERETKDKVEGCVQEGHADCRTERGR